MTETKLLAAFAGVPEVDHVYQCDLFALCDAMPAASVDMILCDLPYGTTACWFDEVIPFAPMWKAFKRILKPERVIVLTGSQPFTTKLIVSNIADFRYEWIWEKSLATGYLNANRNPMKAHENILVFYEGLKVYNPQMTAGKPYRATSGAVGGHVRDKTVGGYVTSNDGQRYPRSVLRYKSEPNPLHPTQKPTELFRYLVRTYTLPGETVFDPCVGSGTTALAAMAEKRRFVCGDQSLEYVEIARERLRKHSGDVSDLPLFQAQMVSA